MPVLATQYQTTNPTVTAAMQDVFMHVPHLRYCLGNWRSGTSTVLGPISSSIIILQLALCTLPYSTCMQYVEAGSHQGVEFGPTSMVSITSGEMVHNINIKWVVLPLWHKLSLEQ